MRVYVGDETGLVKAYGIEGKQVAAKWRRQQRQRAPTLLAFATPAEDELLLALADGSLEVLQPGTGESRGVGSEAQRRVVPEGRSVAGIHTLHTDSGRTFACCDSAGVLHLVPDTPEGDDDAGEEWRVGQAADCMRFSANPSVFAIGGKEQNVRIWDLERRDKPLFQAKNVKNDRINMPVPVWNADVGFVPGTGQCQIAACTKHHQFRVYDSRVKTRPVINMEIGELPLQTMVMASAHRAVVGDTQGNVLGLDLRNGHQVAKYRGLAGACRQLAIHPVSPYLASVSVDRFLRIHHLESQQLLHKVYLKQRLNCCLFASEEEVYETKEDRERQLDDHIWGAMGSAKAGSGKQGPKHARDTEGDEEKEVEAGEQEEAVEAEGQAVARRRTKRRRVKAQS